MAHARREDLADIDDVLCDLRTLPGLVERSPGVFYLGRTPFLHFHTRAGARWADVRAGLDWGPEMPLPFGASRRAKSTFVKEVRQRYDACTSGAPGRPTAARTR